MIECEMVSLDDLYHPHTLEHYDPECCCAYCLDVSIARARQKTANAYRSMRKSGKGKIARLLWKRTRAAEKILQAKIADQLFSESSTPPRSVGGLQALLGKT